MRGILSRPFIQDGWSTVWDASPILCAVLTMVVLAVYVGSMVLANCFGISCGLAIGIAIIASVLTTGVGGWLIFDVIALRYGTPCVEDNSEN